MDEETLKLLTDLHIHNQRQGPGSQASFELMMKLSNINKTAKIEIADIGSGTGSSTIPLLQNTNANVTAVELLPAFLTELTEQAKENNLLERVTTIEADMADLPFQDEQFDVIWSEGAVYNIGFEKGVREWKRFLKTNGIMVLSEITWLTLDVPEKLRSHWEQEYPEIDTASNKIALLEKNGYAPIGYFPLSSDCWLDNYYKPLEASFADFLDRHNHSDMAKEIVVAEEKEIALYKEFQDYISYGVYISKKL
jgi:SAM-dependent methyltransferase